MKLRDWLKARAVTQDAFGERIGRSQQAVSRYCDGRVPDKETIRRIHAATDGEVGPPDWYDLPTPAAQAAADVAA